MSGGRVMIDYGADYTCRHGEPPGECPHGCKPPCRCREDPRDCKRHWLDSDTRDTVSLGVSLKNTGPDQRIHVVSDSGDTGDTPNGRRTHWTAAELMATDFPEPKWAVPGIVAEGVTVLAGPPKVGKSWLSLGLGVATATGGKALGNIDVDAGPALYLALEDTGRRLKTRLTKVLGPEPGPDTLTLATQCPPLPNGGDREIAGWIEKHRDARLVVIDVLARVRGQVGRDVSLYDADYAAVARAKSVADHYGVPFVVVHHTRKSKAEDFLDEVSGTHGVVGAADAVLVLKRLRGKADGLLQVTGRDVEESSYALSFAADIGAWQLSDTPADEVMLGDTRAAILRDVRDNEGARPKEIAERTGLDSATVRQTARRMADDDQLDTDGHGRYFPPNTPVTPVTGVTFPGHSTNAGVTPLSLDVTRTEQSPSPRDQVTGNESQEHTP